MKQFFITLLLFLSTSLYANTDSGNVLLGTTASSFGQNVLKEHWDAVASCTYTRKVEGGTDEVLAAEVAFGTSRLVQLPSGSHYLSTYCYSYDDFGGKLELFREENRQVSVIADDTVTARFELLPSGDKTVQYCPDISLPASFSVLLRKTGEITRSLNSDNCWEITTSDLNPSVKVSFNGEMYLIKPSKGMYSHTAYAKQLVTLEPIAGDVQVIITLGSESPITTGMELDEQKSSYIVFTRIGETASYTLQSYADGSMNVVQSIDSWVRDSTTVEQALSPSSAIQILAGPAEFRFERYLPGQFVRLSKSGGL
jgi:hypothetical protein